MLISKSLSQMSADHFHGSQLYYGMSNKPFFTDEMLIRQTKTSHTQKLLDFTYF
jgi:hypothetical protein